VSHFPRQPLWRRLTEDFSMARRSDLSFAFLALLLAILLAWLVMLLVQQASLADGRRRLTEIAERTSLGLAGETLRSPVMGAATLLGLTDPAVKDLLRKHAPEPAVDAAPMAAPVVALATEPAERFAAFRRQFGVEALFVVAADGTVVYHESATGRQAAGANVAARSYFRRAMEGRANVYAGVGQTTGERGVYLAVPVHESNSRSSPVLGMLLLKLPAEPVDRYLAQAAVDAILLSPQGVAFAASRKEWVGAIEGTPTPERIESIRKLAQFGYFVEQTVPRQLPYEVRNDWIPFEEGQIIVERPLDWGDPAGFWRVVVLRSTNEFAAPVWIINSGVMTALLVLLIAAVILHYRRGYQDIEAVRRRLRLQGIAIDNAATAVIVCATDLAMEWVNPRFSQLSGYSVAEIAGRPLAILAADAEARAAVQALETALHAGQAWQGEIVCQSKDGTAYTALSGFSPVFDRERRLLGYVGVQEDISERRALQGQIHEYQRIALAAKAFVEVLRPCRSPVELARAALTHIVRTLSLPYAALHLRDGERSGSLLASFGEAAEVGNGLPGRAALVGDVMGDERALVLDQPGEDSGLARIDILPVGARPCAGALEVGWLAPPAQVHGVFLELIMPQLAMALAYAMGGDRAQMLAAIEQKSAEWQLLLAAVSDGVIGLDGGGRIAFINPVAQGQLGLPATESLLGQEGRDLIIRASNGDATPVENPLRRAMEQRVAERFDTAELLRADGSRVSMSCVIKPVLQGENLAGLLLVLPQTAQGDAHERGLPREGGS
jgi:two-component system sensor histidine kinase/response regulator